MTTYEEIQSLTKRDPAKVIEGAKLYKNRSWYRNVKGEIVSGGAQYGRGDSVEISYDTLCDLIEYAERVDT